MTVRKPSASLAPVISSLTRKEMRGQPATVRMGRRTVRRMRELHRACQSHSTTRAKPMALRVFLMRWRSRREQVTPAAHSLPIQLCKAFWTVSPGSVVVSPALSVAQTEHAIGLHIGNLLRRHPVSPVRVAAIVSAALYGAKAACMPGLSGHTDQHELRIRTTQSRGTVTSLSYDACDIARV